MNKLYGDKIYTIDNFLSNEKCAEWIHRAETKGFRDSPVSGGGHGRTNGETPRTSQFCVMDDIVQSQELWKLIKDHVPNDLTHIDKMA